MPFLLGFQAFHPDNVFMFLKDQNILSPPTSRLQTTQVFRSVGKSAGIKFLLIEFFPFSRLSRKAVIVRK